LLLLTAQLKAQSGQQDSGNDFLKMVMQIGGSVLGASDTPWWLA